MACAWAAIGDQIPETRPSAGPLAAFWDLGKLFGRPALVATISFAAYVLGALLEFNPELLWRYGGRPEWVTELLRRWPVTWRLLEWVRSPALSLASQKDIVRILNSGKSDRSTGTRLFGQLLTEIRQLATRLQASHPELYDKYDRLLAEARFRFNIALPIAVLLPLVAIRSAAGTIGISVVVTVTGVIVLLLMRQVAARVSQANEVIAQAWIIGLVASSTAETRKSDAASSASE